MRQHMDETTRLSAPSIEVLYSESLELADEARAAFDFSGVPRDFGEDEDLKRIALSCEALRTTTRMMHAIAWLLNQRAFFAGELSEFQLRRHGRLPPAQPEASLDHVALLEPDLRSLIERTQRFYARIERLDRAWREHFAMHPAAIHRLRERLGLAVASL